MFQIFPLPKLNMVAAFLALFITIHSFQNDKLSKRSRRYFSLTFLVVLISIVLEYVYPFIPPSISRHTVEFIYIIVMCSDQFVMLLLFKACELRKSGPYWVLAAIAGVHVVVELIMHPLDLIFYIDSANEFHYGPAGWVYAVFGVLTYIAVGLIYLQLGKRFNHRKVQYLIASMIAMLLGIIGDQLDAVYGAAYLLQVFGLLFLYVYYSDLCTLSLIESLENSKNQMAYTLARAIDAKDKYTNGHSVRVADYSALLAKAVGFDDKAAEALKNQAMLHDVGKIGVPDSVLNKAGKLDDVEYEMIKSHTRMGGDIISHMSSMQEAYAVCRNHHERYDGTGYPDGLKGEDIPLAARIVAIADSFDAMNSNRIYRRALPKEVTRNELIKGAGSQFDPKLLEAFVKLFDEGKLNSVADKYLSESENLSSFELELKDLFLAFDIKRDYKKDWDKEFEKFDQLKGYLDRLHKGEKVDFALCNIDISPKDEKVVPRNLQDAALETMEEVVGAATRDASLCQRVSTHQLAVVLIGKDAVNSRDSMQNILLYFYKIFETSAFDINFDIYN